MDGEIKKKKKSSDGGRNAGRVQGGNRAGSELTDRDIEIVGWLGRHRLATADQVMRRFGMHRAKAYARLGVLVESGLARYEPGIRSKRVYLATRVGLTRAGLQLTQATVSPASFAHDLATVEVAIDLERRLGGGVLAEREMRASKLSADFQITEPVSRAVMWPDLVIEHLERQAIEVELTLKSKDRLRAKMLAYSASSYALVTYRVDDRAVAAAVRDAGRDAGLGDRLRVEPLRSLDSRRRGAGLVSGDTTTELATEARRLQTELDRAHEEIRTQRAELDAQIREADRQSTNTRLIVNEILDYLDAGRQRRGEIVRRWEAQMAKLRGRRY